MKTDIQFRSYLAQFFSEWEMFEKRGLEKIKTHFVFNNSPPPTPRKSWRLWDNVEKYRTAVQATDDNRAHAHCTLVN